MLSFKALLFLSIVLTAEYMKIAVVGGGISGMAAAYLLQQRHDITLYEKNDYIGGHSRTLEVRTGQGMVPVDTGFIVYNTRNYPHLTALFAHLNVPTKASDMSFGVTIDRGWYEYGTQSLSAIFAQKRNMLRLPFWKMMRDIFYFNRHALRFAEAHPEMRLGQLIEAMKLGKWFQHYYILAVGGAIWSTPVKGMLDFPALAFVRFFQQHGLLSVHGQPQWYTVDGGSKAYVERLTHSFASRIRLSSPVREVRRQEDGVVVRTVQGEAALYDHVVLACHGDEALALLANPTKEETAQLSCFRYQENTVVLHSDTSFMPKRRAAWASWVYQLQGRTDESPAIALTYWMNRLQNLPAHTPLFVSLNPGRMPAVHLTHNVHQFSHPLFDNAAVRAQAKLKDINGVDGLSYCGAYHANGFHEDGLQSAVNVAQALGCTVPW